METIRGTSLFAVHLLAWWKFVLITITMVKFVQFHWALSIITDYWHWWPKRRTWPATITLNNKHFSCLGSAADNRTNASYSNADTFSAALLIAVSSPVAVVGNAFILAAICKKTFLRTPFHILLSGLAISDLCTGLIAQPFIVTVTFIYLKQPKEICDNPKVHLALLGIANGSATYLITITVFFITLISIERWLHMYRRSLVTAHHGYFTVTTVLSLPIPLVVVRLFGDVKPETYRSGVYTTILTLMLFCFLTTSFAYFKVYQIIRHHQRRVQEHETPQNFGQPAIDLAKYKKSVVSILYILLLFSVCFLPFVVSTGIFVFLGETPEVVVASGVSMVLLFFSSALNPGLYLWRMNDIRNAVKQLFWGCFSLKSKFSIMVRALDSESSGPGSTRGRWHCINRYQGIKWWGNPAMD